MNTTDQIAAEAEWYVTTWDQSWAKSHEERGQHDVWDIKCGNKTIASHLPRKVCNQIVAVHKAAIEKAKDSMTDRELADRWFKLAIEKAMDDYVASGVAEQKIANRAAQASEKCHVSEVAICANCGTQQHDQIDHICTTCNRAELVNLVDILKEGREWLKSRAAQASEK